MRGQPGTGRADPLHNRLPSGLVRRHDAAQLTLDLAHSIIHGRGQRAEPGHGSSSAAIEAQAKRRRGEPGILPRSQRGIGAGPADGGDSRLNRGEVGHHAVEPTNRGSPCCKLGKPGGSPLGTSPYEAIEGASSADRPGPCATGTADEPRAFGTPAE